MTPFIFQVGLGFLVGLAMIIPGVSAGTIAIILGIYLPTLHTINHLAAAPLKIGQKDRRLPVLTLGCLGIGVSLGILFGAHLISYYLETNPTLVYALFLGFLLSGFHILRERPWVQSPSSIGLAITGIGICLIIGLTHLQPLEPIPLIPLTSFKIGLLALSGFVGAGTMMLPGISGSMVLEILGSYGMIREAITQFHLTSLGVLFCSALLGGLMLARGLQWILDKHLNLGYWLVVGLLLGSAYKLAISMGSFHLKILPAILVGCMESELFQKKLEEAIRHFDQGLSADLVTLIQSKHQTLSVAESFTNGLLGLHLAHMLDQMSFVGSVIACDLKMAISLLGVSPTVIRNESMASISVVMTMCKRIQAITHSRLAMAISGVFEGQKAKVCMGFILGTLKKDYTFSFRGDLLDVQVQSVTTGLMTLRTLMQQQVS